MPAFPVYNRRVDLDLSTKGAGFDVVNATFIYSDDRVKAQQAVNRKARIHADIGKNPFQ